MIYGKSVALLFFVFRFFFFITFFTRVCECRSPKTENTLKWFPILSRHEWSREMGKWHLICEFCTIDIDGSNKRPQKRPHRHTHTYAISNSNFTEILIALFFSFCLLWILLLFVFIIIKQYKYCVSTRNDKPRGVLILWGRHCRQYKQSNAVAVVISDFFGCQCTYVVHSSPIRLCRLLLISVRKCGRAPRF